MKNQPPLAVVGGIMVLGGALGPDLSPVTPRHFAWQAWHLVTSTFISRGRHGTKLASTVVLRGRRGTHGTGWRAWSGFVTCDAAALCVAGVAGVALGDIHLRFTWQAWHKNSHPPSFCVAGVALMVLGGALGPDLSPVTPRHFAWQAWHLVTSTFVSRGMRGTNSHPPSFCVAGVALMVLGGALGPDLSPVTPRHFAWQAWHLVTSTFVSRGRRGTKLASTVVLRGRHCTHGTGWRAWSGFVTCDAAALCVAGVALGDIHLRFTWQAWHKTRTLRPPSFCVAGVALMVLGGALGPDLSPVTPRHFAWQAWHLVTSTFVSRGRRGTKLASTVVLRGRRGTHGTGWRAWSGFSPVTPRHFAWQAWHLVTSTFVSRGRRGTKLASTVVLRGRRGTHGTGWRAWSGFVACDAAALCVAGVALGDIHLHFTWQAWHKLASTVVLRGRRGTIFDTPSFIHHFVTHHLSHTTLSHTIFHHTLFHTPLCHHTIFHTQLWHTIFHTPLGHTPSLTHRLLRTIFVTLHLSHTIFHHTILHTPLCHTHHFSPHHLSHTTLSHTIFHRTILFFFFSHTTLSHIIFRHTIFHTPLCHTHHLSHTTLSHALFHTQLSHTHHISHTALSHTYTPSSFVTHHLSHSTLSHTHNCFNFSILHHLLCLSFLLRPCYNL